jgi:integrase
LSRSAKQTLVGRTLPQTQKALQSPVSHYWDDARANWRRPRDGHAASDTGDQEYQTQPLTVRQLIALYRSSRSYRDLQASSKQSYDLYLARIAEKFGDLPVSAFEKRGARAAIRQWRDNVLAHLPRTADFTVGTLRRLLNFAVDEEYINRNPAALLGRLHTTSRRDQIWSDADITSFVSKAPRYLARALLLAIWTGQRQSDLLALTWDCYDGTYIRLEQRKGRGGQGHRVKILVSKELKRVLEEIREEQIERSLHPNRKRRRPEPSVILTTEKGQPWRSGFGCAWRKAARHVGIEGLTFHDLRGTFITVAHRAGSTIKEIAEASGHDETECERVIRRNYLATGAELLISRLEVVSDFTKVRWDAVAHAKVAPTDEDDLLRVRRRAPGSRRSRTVAS